MTAWRLATQIDDIRLPLRMIAQGKPAQFAIATLVEVAGSAPREAGAQMLITADEHWGFLSGGCIEDDIALHGREVLAQGTPRLLRYGEGSPWIDIKLACGSAISVLVEQASTADPAITTLLDGFTSRFPVMWHSDGTHRAAGLAGDPASSPASAPVSDGLRFSWDGARYIRRFDPALRLVLVGADAAALASAALARELGWDVVLIAPGGPIEAPFEGIGYYHGDAARILAELGPDAWSAVAILSHDREDDESALATALLSEAFYTGAVGARARLETRREKLRHHGVDEARLARLHAPIGLDGFGKSPREIALSLVAEVARKFHARSAAARSKGASISMSAPASSTAR